MAGQWPNTSGKPLGTNLPVSTSQTRTCTGDFQAARVELPVRAKTGHGMTPFSFHGIRRSNVAFASGLPVRSLASTGIRATRKPRLGHVFPFSVFYGLPPSRYPTLCNNPERVPPAATDDVAVGVDLGRRTIPIRCRSYRVFRAGSVLATPTWALPVLVFSANDRLPRKNLIRRLVEQKSNALSAGSLIGPPRKAYSHSCVFRQPVMPAWIRVEVVQSR